MWELSQIPAGNNIHHSTKKKKIKNNHTLYKFHLSRQLFHQNYVFCKCLQSYLLFKLDRIKKRNSLRNPSATQRQTDPGD